MSEENDFLKSYNQKDNLDEKESVPAKEDAALSNKENNDMVYHQKSTFQSSRHNNSTNYDSSSKRNYRDARSSKNTIAVILTIVSVTLVIIMLVAIGANKIEIPSFSGWSRNDFMLWASENEVITQIDDQYSETITIDMIISQSFMQGEKIKKGDFVRVAISKGPDLTVKLQLPDVMNMTMTEIQSWADKNFMTKVRITTENSETIKSGNVIKYEINDNTVVDQVKRDTPIYIVVSKGPSKDGAKEIEIPDFRTLGISETMIFVQENGLDIIIDKQYDEYIPKDSIISQSEKPKSLLKAGDQIRIIVSLGRKTLMISFKGLTKAEALSKAAKLGISAAISERYSSSSEGRMIWQSVEEGTEITEDTQLELKYSLGSKIAVGNNIGQKKIILEQWLVQENALGARLSIKTTYTQNSATSGTILQQTPKDAFVSRDTVISIIVSSGSVLFVPDFVAPLGSGYDTAITRDKALEMIAGMDIVIIFISEENVQRLPGEVWNQSIAPGTEITAGTSLVLKYRPQGTTIDIPNFVGKTPVEVIAMSQYNLLHVTFVQGDYSYLNAGKVYSQSIAANTTMAQGTAITLYTSPEILVLVPDFSGMTQADVLASDDYEKFDITFVQGDSTDPGVETGKMYDQSINAGQSVLKGSPITLTYGP
ncbi:MAG: PASTA domain-containing protein [Clostridiales bacterium]|nr:PASTA domain-containing protein [Clostridiales bacterium]